MITPIIEFFVSYAKSTSPGKMLVQAMIFLFVVTWLGVISLFVANFSTVMDIWDRYQSQSNVAIADALEVSTQVNALLHDQRARLDVDRLYVSRFHNGKVDLTGVHFIFFSRVAESTGNGISNEMTRTQNLPLSIFPQMLTPLAQGTCHSIDHVDSSVENSTFLMEMGINSMVVCPIFDTTGHLMAIVGADGVVDQINSQEAVGIQQSLQTLSTVLGGLLTTS